MAQNASALQAKLAERQKLLSQLDQAKMQEQMNTAMTTLGEAVGEDVPTFNEIRDKIEARYAKAKGVAEISSGNVSDRMLEIERASMDSEAQERLSEIRTQLGLPVGEAEGDRLLSEAASLKQDAITTGDGTTAAAEPSSKPETA